MAKTDNYNRMGALAFFMGAFCFMGANYAANRKLFDVDFRTCYISFARIRHFLRKRQQSGNG
jgi:hypothetical protein